MRGMSRLRGAGVSPAKVGARLNLLIGERRSLVVALAACSVLSGFAEAALLAIVAQIAVTLAGKGHHAKLEGFHIHASTSHLIAIGFALAIFRLLMQFPLSLLPAQIAGDVQASSRKRLFHAFTMASWDVQSSDREGQLQETMTGQVMQATSGALQATSLITSSLSFLMLIAFAFALNAIAAAAVFATAIAMFGVLRPMRGVAVRRSRALSKAQIRYASSARRGEPARRRDAGVRRRGRPARADRRLHRDRAGPLLPLAADRAPRPEPLPEPHLPGAPGRAGGSGGGGHAGTPPRSAP